DHQIDMPSHAVGLKEIEMVGVRFGNDGVLDRSGAQNLVVEVHQEKPANEWIVDVGVLEYASKHPDAGAGRPEPLDERFERLGLERLDDLARVAPKRGDIRAKLPEDPHKVLVDRQPAFQCLSARSDLLKLPKNHLWCVTPQPREDAGHEARIDREIA